MQDKLGNESAYPFFTWNIPGYGNCVTIQDKDGNMNHLEFVSGISKRFYAANIAMQGLLANPNLSNNLTEDIIGIAYKFADELLKQETL